MRRRLVAILPYLFFGAVLSVLIAWLLPDIGNSWGDDLIITPEHLQWWHDHAPPGFDPEPVSVGVNESLGVEHFGMCEHFRPEISRNVGHVSRIRFGFPWLALECLSWGDSTGRNVGWRGALSIGSHTCPLQPLWLGLALDTLFFAALLFCGLRGPRKLRGLWRLNHRRCPRCAYPVGISDKCSECGTPLPEYARTTPRAKPLLELWRYHRVVLVVIILLLGALMTVLTTVTVAVTQPAPEAMRTSPGSPEDEQWLREHCKDTDLERLADVRVRSSPGVEHVVLTTHSGVGRVGVMEDAHYGARTATCRYRMGWPLQAFQGVDWFGLAELPQPSRRVYSSPSALFIRRDDRSPIVLPLQPLWPGLIVNTLMYSAVLAVYAWLRLRGAGAAQA